MSDDWSVIVEQTGAQAPAPLDLPEMEGALIDYVQPKLFNKWSSFTRGALPSAEHCHWWITLAVKEKYSIIGSFFLTQCTTVRFRKAGCPIVERLCNSMMMHGRNNGKKLMTVRIVKHAFEIIHLLSGENPVQVLVNAIINSGPREDSTRIGRAGTVRRQAVDVSPLRRVNQAIWLICTGAREAAFRNIKTIAECLADEIMNAAKGSSNSYAIKKKDELERVAKSNR
ncbi:ribosomal protein S7 [Cooperia oncophora]